MTKDSVVKHKGDETYVKCEHCELSPTHRKNIICEDKLPFRSNLTKNKMEFV